MTEMPGMAGVDFGHAGRLTYLPKERDSRGEGILHSERTSYNIPQFKVLQTSTTGIYPPAIRPLPKASSQLWDERRVQSRWLLKTHPEACVGDTPVLDYLAEDMSRFSQACESPPAHQLFCLGSIGDVTIRGHPVDVAVLAMASGEAGETLRLARIRESTWELRGDETASVETASVEAADIDLTDREEEATWMASGLPITRIKFVRGATKAGLLRWLIVQKLDSTTVLQPQYHSVPVETSQFGSRPSRIDPNPVLTLTHRETGGNAHADVSFNPAGAGRPAQLAIMDECGYWTVWAIQGKNTLAKNSLQLLPFKCGHIGNSPLNEIPLQSSASAGIHGILFVGSRETGRPEINAAHSENSPRAKVERSQHLLMWNPESLEIFDLSRNTMLPKAPVGPTAADPVDRIIDVKLSPIDSMQVFVLTKKHVHWIAVPKQKRKEGPGIPPRVVSSSSHLIAGETEPKMTVCAVGEDAYAASLVLVYSQQQAPVTVFEFKMTWGTSLPKWSRRTMQWPLESEAGTSTPRSSVQQIQIHPLNIRVAAESNGREQASASGPAGCCFYQILVLGEDLSLRYCLAYMSRDLGSRGISSPMQLEASSLDQRRDWKKKRTRFIRHLLDTFVLPDGIAEADLHLLVKPHLDTDYLSQWARWKTSVPQEPRKVSFKIHQLQSVVCDFWNTRSNNEETCSIEQMGRAIRGAIAAGIAEGKLPFTTWLDMINGLGLPMLQMVARDQLDTLVQEIVETSDGGLRFPAISQGPRRDNLYSTPGWFDLDQYFKSLWVGDTSNQISSEYQAIKEAFISDLAVEATLANAGIVLEDVPLFGTTQAGKLPETPGRISSSSAATIEPDRSQPAALDSATSEPQDAAIKRLQLLAKSFDAAPLGDVQQSKVLSRWPSQRGVTTDGYVSSVAEADDSKFDAARQKVKQIEARRKALTDKYRLASRRRQMVQSSQTDEPGAGPSTQRDIMTSQPVPLSSQGYDSQVAMSQPVPGAFGTRKTPKLVPKKKKKKKSGFR